MTQRTMKKNLDEYTALTRQIAELEARKQAPPFDNLNSYMNGLYRFMLFLFLGVR